MREGGAPRNLPTQAAPPSLPARAEAARGRGQGRRGQALGWRARLSLERLPDSQFGLVVVLPALVVLLLVIGYPTFYVFYLSLFDYGTTMTPVFVGLRNYVQAFTDDPYFLAYLWHSVEYTVIAMAIAFLVALAVALVLNHTKVMTGPLRTVTLWAWGVPPVIASLMWKWILNDSFGVLNDLLLRLGIIQQPVAWLANEAMVMPVMSLVHAWTAIPFIVVMLLAALQSIPGELYEAAAIDGATPIQSFWYVTARFLRSAVRNAMMISTIFAFRTFDIVFTLTKGGPGDRTQLLVTYIYETAFRFLRVGYAAALSVVMMVLTIGIVALYLLAFRGESASA